MRQYGLQGPEFSNLGVVGCGIMFCCSCRHHHIEGRLRKWLMRRRKLRVCVTKRMLIRKAKEMSSDIAALKPAQLENWWAGFRRRRNISSRRITSYRRACDESVMPLVRRYRATLYDAIRKGKIQWLANGDETQVSLEPVPTKCLDDRANGKIKRELQALKKQNACKGIEQTVTTKGKNNEAAMVFIVRETLMGTIPFGKDEKGVYAVDGAPCHMHVSVCRVFRSPHVSMPLFIGPPNGTPYAQACDKPGFNGTFKGELEEEYAMWAEEKIMGRTKKQGPVPQPSRKEVANWVVRAFAAITDDAIREACRTAYFPSGLKLSQLEDTEFFKKHDPESDSDDGSQTDTDDSGDSDDSSGVDDSDSDDDRECDVVWAKLGRWVWGLCHVFEDTLYLTRDLMEDSAVPSNLSVPKVSDSDGAATSARAKKSPKPGEHVQLFRMKRDRNKGFYSEKC